MDRCYVLRLHGGVLACFYFDEAKRGIVCRRFEQNRWERETLLISDTRRHFSICMDRNGAVYLFCQDITGNISLCTNKGGNWQSKIILENRSNKIHTLNMHAIINDGAICLLYNMPDAEDNSMNIVAQNLSESGRWSPAERIDRFVAGKNRMFTLTRVSGNHALIFYQTHTHENIMGYREVTASARGSYNAFLNTHHQIIDTAFLTTDDTIHTLCAVRGMFSCQLIYRRKRAERFEDPILLWESQNIDNCLLFFVKGHLYVTFEINGQMFCCISDNGGGVFSRPFRYKSKCCLHPHKAAFISHDPLDEREYRMNEVYVDTDNVWDIQLLPDLYEDFYAIHGPHPEAGIQIKPQTAVQSFETPPRQAADGETRERFTIIKNQLTLAQKQSLEKDEQILQLSNRIQQQNDELNVLEVERRRLLRQINEMEESLKTERETRDNPIYTSDTKPTVQEDVAEETPMVYAVEDTPVYAAEDTLTRNAEEASGETDPPPQAE